MEDLEAALAATPDAPTARRYLAAAKAAGRRDAAVAFLAGLYRKTRHPGLWEVARDAFTGPELEGLAPPEETTVGPEKEPLLPRRPYRDVVLSSFKAPFANASSIFVLAVSGPLMLGAMLAMQFLGFFGLGIAAFLLGYLIGFLFDVAEQAAQGRERGPRLLSLIWSEESRFVFVFHFLNWLGALAATWWPAVLLVMGARDASPAWMTLVSVVAFLLSAWFPIAILQAVFGNGFSAFNYAKAVERVRRLGADYAICAGLFLATTLAGAAIQAAALAWAAGGEERVLAARVLGGWAVYASWLVQMRAVGLLAWARAEIR
ncbi:MAG TPA: hypothetical protein VF950_22805 [Planctomycetota bacterium]